MSPPRQGFDARGNECYWTVTGDDVTALALCDVDDDARTELVVGSADSEIRVFRGEDSVADVTEADAVAALTGIRNTSFGFALANGTIGAYHKMKKAWSTKCKAAAVALCAFDLDGDGAFAVGVFSWLSASRPHLGTCRRLLTH